MADAGFTTDRRDDLSRVLDLLERCLELCGRRLALDERRLAWEEARLRQDEALLARELDGENDPPEPRGFPGVAGVRPRH